MSSDIATLSQALGTVAKFARVMHKAGLSDEFYQKAIDESDFREAIVWLSEQPRQVEHNLQQRAKMLLSEVENRLVTLGVSVNEAPLEKNYHLAPETFHFNINYFEYNESRKLRSGPVSLYWSLTINDSGGGLEAEVSISLHLSEEKYFAWWSINFDVDDSCKLMTDDLSLVDKVKKHSEPFTITDLSPEERWFMGHCRFMDRLDRLGEWADHSDPHLTRQEGLDLLDVMVETFNTSHKYFNREHAENEIACPRCGGIAVPSHEETLQDERRTVYACTEGCLMDVQILGEGWAKTSMKFYFGRAGWPRMAPMLL
jgi:hypothetical protein